MVVKKRKKEKRGNIENQNLGSISFHCIFNVCIREYDFEYDRMVKKNLCDRSWLVCWGFVR